MTTQRLATGFVLAACLIATPRFAEAGNFSPLKIASRLRATLHFAVPASLGNTSLTPKRTAALLGAVPGAVTLGAGAAIVGGAVGVVVTGVDSLSLSTQELKEVEIDGQKSAIVVKKVPGLAKAAMWGLAGLGATALGFAPDSWLGPYGHAGGWVTAHLPNVHPLVAGFAAGVSARLVTGGIVGGASLGAVGAVAGGMGTASLTGRAIEKIQRSFSRKSKGD